MLFNNTFLLTTDFQINNTYSKANCHQFQNNFFVQYGSTSVSQHHQFRTGGIC